jgi:hypothetical protein
MNQNIFKQLELIEKSNAWIKSSLDGEKQKNAYRTMVDFRRKLNKKKFSLEGNPAAAMYGESQMGKSYLVSSLLSESGKPFTIIDGQENTYDFINKINPIGKGAESTSLVTRFSTDYKWENPEFPIKAKLLSPADLVLVLCDGYYNDVKAKIDIALKSDEINGKVLELCNRYENKSIQQTQLSEDDIIDIKDYFDKNFSVKTSRINDSIFFEKIPSLIANTEPVEWSEIFGLLWNKNPKITKLFSELLKQYEKLDFTTEIYLPIEAVLRDNGTLLDVARLHEIYGKYEGSEPTYKEDTSVMILNKGQAKTVNNFSKSYLCALTAELIFRLPKELERGKQFLKNTDLLDFPGARHRLGIHEEDIDDKSIPQMLLRGKVAYLFNKYSYSEKINILLFCHSDRQSAQSIMPEILANWIGDMIGETPDERQAFIEKSKVSPLFIVSTMFNIDLQFDFNNDQKGNVNFLNNRWEKRFLKVLKKEIIGSETYRWLEGWATTKPNFDNIYLLRDLYYSSETNSKIYEGYNKNKAEIKEIIPETYPEFRKDLRQTFIEYPFVKRHFVNPAESWDRAASINEDGTKLIIDKLTLAADNINLARAEKLFNELKGISQNIIAELLKYFYSNDKDEELQKAKFIAGDIQHKLDIAFNADGIKLYGQLMKELMLDESAVLELFRKKIDDIEHREVINMNPYITYRMQVPVIVNEEDGTVVDTADTYFERLCVHYVKTTAEQKQQFLAELNANQIDLEKLINGNSDLIKNNAQQLAEALLEYWFVYVALNDKHIIQQILAAKDSSALQDITDMFQKLFKKLGLSEQIAKRIRRYIDGHNKTELPYETVADISAELLNKCINTVGFEYLDQSEINDLQLANEKNRLGLVLDQPVNQAGKSVEDLFIKIENWTDIIQSKPEEMRSLPNYRNYLLWYNRLKVGFVSVCNIPNYDVTANEKLGGIIEEYKTIKY